MRRKITSLVLAAVLGLSASVPSFAGAVNVPKMTDETVRARSTDTYTIMFPADRSLHHPGDQLRLRG